MPSDNSTQPKSLTFLKGIVSAGSILAIGTFAVLAFIRLRYPYELEWLESEMLEHVRRLHDGQPLYTSPTVDLTQLPYAPLMFGVGALASEIFGVHFWVLRVISILSALGTFALLGLLVYRESKSKFAAVFAAGLYAATYRYSGTFYDVAKSDALFMLLSTAAILFARRVEHWRNAIIAGALMAFALMTKQTAMFFFVPIAFYLIVTKWRFGAIFSTTTLAITGLATFILHQVTNGWYTFFVWELLFEHDVAESSRVEFFTKDLKMFIPVVIVVALSWKVWSKREEWWTTGFYAAVAAGLFAGAWTGRLHTGGFTNVLMPAALAMAILCGIAIGQILRRPNRLAYIGVVLCGLQLCVFTYKPNTVLPTEADERTGDALITTIRSIDGEVWLTRHPAYASMAGKTTLAGHGGVEDVLRAKSDSKAQKLLRDDIADAIHSQRFAAIILDDMHDTRGFPSDWESYYVKDDTAVVPNDGTFSPVASKTGAPRILLVKKVEPHSSS